MRKGKGYCDAQAAEGRLEAMLREERLSSSLSPLIRESFLQSVCSRTKSSGHAGDAASSEHSMSAQLQLCREQLHRRTFLMKQCNAETRLALAACDWAAEKSQASFSVTSDDEPDLVTQACAFL